MQTGDVLLFIGGSGFIDKEISHYEKSMFTHAAVAINETEIIEAWFNGVRIAPIAGRNPFVIFRYDLNPTQTEDIKMYAEGSVGKRYNYPGLFGFLVEKWLHLKHNPFGSHHNVICSQLVFDCYLAAGINLIPGFGDEDVKPSDIANSPLLRRVEA